MKTTTTHKLHPLHNMKSKIMMIQQQQQQQQLCFYNYYSPIMLVLVLPYSIVAAAAANTTMRIDDVSSHVCTVCKNLSSSSSTRARRIQYQYEIFSETTILPSSTTSNTFNRLPVQQNHHHQQHRNMIVNNSNTILLESSNVTVTNYGTVPVSSEIADDSVSFLDSRTDCTKNCTPGIEFCGTDQMCHINSCINLYLYGPKYFTGVIDSTDTSELQCSSISPITTTTVSTTIAPTSIQYGCTVLGSSSSSSSSSGTGNEPIKVPCSGSDEEGSSDQQLLYFTQMCTAQPAKDVTFVCYDLIDTTNFTQYKLNTIPSDNDKCSSSSTTSSTTKTGLSLIPIKQHNYGIDLLRIDTRPESFSCNKVSTILSSTNLIEALAYGTISSVLYIKGNTTKVPVNNNNSTFNNNNNNNNNTTELPPPNTGPASSSATTTLYYSATGIGSVLIAVVAVFL